MLVDRAPRFSYVDNGIFHEIFHEIFPLDLKGKILHHARCFVHNGNILCKLFWRIFALVFEHYKL